MCVQVFTDGWAQMADYLEILTQAHPWLHQCVLTMKTSYHYIYHVTYKMYDALTLLIKGNFIKCRPNTIATSHLSAKFLAAIYAN